MLRFVLNVHCKNVKCECYLHKFNGFAEKVVFSTQFFSNSSHTLQETYFKRRIILIC